MKTILVVDDNSTLAYFTARSLEQNIEGVEVTTASSCQEARAKAGVLAPHVVIADIKLPDGNGLELIRELSELLPQIRAIIASGTDIPKGTQRNLIGSLKKPYGEELLVNMVLKALNPTGLSDIENLDDQVCQDQPARSLVYDRHYVRNRLSALLAGLRALQADLNADANEAPAVRHLADVHVERLFGIALELADIMKQGDGKWRCCDEQRNDFSAPC